MGYPEPAVSIVRSVRRDPRLAGVLIGAPAGQPDSAEWAAVLGSDGAGVPFLRYLPAQLDPLGAQVRDQLQAPLGEPPSFVALAGYDAIAVLAAVLRTDASWAEVAVTGTRGPIRFARPPGSAGWQWTAPPGCGCSPSAPARPGSGASGSGSST